MNAMSKNTDCIVSVDNLADISDEQGFIAAELLATQTSTPLLVGETELLCNNESLPSSGEKHRQKHPENTKQHAPILESLRPRRHVPETYNEHALQLQVESTAKQLQSEHEANRRKRRRLQPPESEPQQKKGRGSGDNDNDVEFICESTVSTGNVAISNENNASLPIIHRLNKNVTLREALYKMMLPYQPRLPPHQYPSQPLRPQLMANTARFAVNPRFNRLNVVKISPKNMRVRPQNFLVPPPPLLNFQSNTKKQSPRYRYFESNTSRPTKPPHPSFNVNQRQNKLISEKSEQNLNRPLITNKSADATHGIDEPVTGETGSCSAKLITPSPATMAKIEAVLDAKISAFRRKNEEHYRQSQQRLFKIGQQRQQSFISHCSQQASTSNLSPPLLQDKLAPKTSSVIQLFQPRLNPLEQASEPSSTIPALHSPVDLSSKQRQVLTSHEQQQIFVRSTPMVMELGKAIFFNDSALKNYVFQKDLPCGQDALVYFYRSIREPNQKFVLVPFGKGIRPLETPYTCAMCYKINACLKQILGPSIKLKIPILLIRAGRLIDDPDNPPIPHTCELSILKVEDRNALLEFSALVCLSELEANIPLPIQKMISRKFEMDSEKIYGIIGVLKPDLLALVDARSPNHSLKHQVQVQPQSQSQPQRLFTPGHNNFTKYSNGNVSRPIPITVPVKVVKSKPTVLSVPLDTRENISKRPPLSSNDKNKASQICQGIVDIPDDNDEIRSACDVDLRLLRLSGALTKWFKGFIQADTPRPIPITFEMLREQAIKFAKDHGTDPSLITNNWLGRINERLSLTLGSSKTGRPCRKLPPNNQQQNEPDKRYGIMNPNELLASLVNNAVELAEQDDSGLSGNNHAKNVFPKITMHIVDSHSAKQLNNVEIPAKSTNNSKTKNATSNDATELSKKSESEHNLCNRLIAPPSMSKHCETSADNVIILDDEEEECEVSSKDSVNLGPVQDENLHLIGTNTFGEEIVFSTELPSQESNMFPESELQIQEVFESEDSHDIICIDETSERNGINNEPTTSTNPTHDVVNELAREGDKNDTIQVGSPVSLDLFQETNDDKCDELHSEMPDIHAKKIHSKVFESLDVVKKAILNLKVGIGSSQSKAVSNALKSHETLSTQFSELLWMQTQENLSDLLKDDSNHKGSESKKDEQ